jgi:hypothetical protein
MTRLLALLALLVFLTIPAGAATHVGTWVQGDAGKVLRLHVTDDTGIGWGTAVGTGYTPSLEVRKVGRDTLYATVTGAWSDATEVDADFGLGQTAAFYPPASQRQMDWEFYLILSKPGVTMRMGANALEEPFSFTIKRWP